MDLVDVMFGVALTSGAGSRTPPGTRSNERFQHGTMADYEAEQALIQSEAQLKAERQQQAMQQQQ